MTPVVARSSGETVLARVGAIGRTILASGLQSGDQAVHSIRTRIGLNAFWSVIGNGVGQTFSLLATVVAARLLGRHRYGELGLIMSTINLFTTLALVGLGTTATKHVAEYKLSDPTRAGRIIGLSSVIATVSGLLVAVLIILFAPYLSGTILKSPELTVDLRLGAILLFFAAINGSQSGTLAGFEAFRELAIANGIRGALTAAFVCALCLRMSVMGAIIGYGVAWLISCGVYRNFIRRQCRRYAIPLSFNGWRFELPLLWRFSIPVLIAGFTFTPAVWWCNTLLATQAGYSQTGLYTAASQFQNVSIFFATAISAVALPMFSTTVAEQNFPKYKRLIILNTVVTTSCVLLVAAPLALFAPLLMKIYGPEFQSAAVVLRILCVSNILSALISSVGHAIWSLSAVVPGMLLAVFRSVVLVVASFFLVHRGAVGLSMSYLIMTIVQTLTESLFLWHLLRRCRNRWKAIEQQEAPGLAFEAHGARN